MRDTVPREVDGIPEADTQCCLSLYEQNYVSMCAGAHTFTFKVKKSLRHFKKV